MKIINVPLFLWMCMRNGCILPKKKYCNASFHCRATLLDLKDQGNYFSLYVTAFHNELKF